MVMNWLEIITPSWTWREFLLHLTFFFRSITVFFPAEVGRLYREPDEDTHVLGMYSGKLTCKRRICFVGRFILIDSSR